MAVTKNYGNAAIAGRLTEARFAAGYKSARQAALRLGLPLGTYKAHENGARSIRPAEIKQYAGAFSVDADWLAHGNGPGRRGAANPATPVDSRSRNEELAKSQRTRLGFIANRLKVARLLAGFANASEACRHYGWNRGTYGNHEYGRSPLGFGWAEMYAVAYGTTADWLRGGPQHPSYPSSINELIRSMEDRARIVVSSNDWHLAWSTSEIREELLLHADPARRGNRDIVDEHYCALQLTRSLERVAAQPGTMENVAAVSLGGLGGVSTRGEMWGFPLEFLKKLFGANAKSTAIALAPHDSLDEGIRSNDILIVEKGAWGTGLLLLQHRTNRSLRRLTKESKFPSVQDVHTDTEIIGRVVGVLRSVR